jgi:NAD(P)-dependent dehydrogenase (short-subunit alcohol dehydrogenase family)
VFAREGADVAVAARRRDSIDEVAAEVEALGRRAIAVPTDITDPEQCVRLAEATFEAFGRIDILVNNAYTAMPYVPFADGDVNDWRNAMEINLWGSLNMTHAVVPYMRDLGEGRIIMTSSPNRHALEGMGAYATSKGALRTASRLLARELGKYGIRVNTVTPGVTADNPNSGRHFAALAEQEGVEPEVVWNRIADANALKYVPSSAEIAEAVLFFASDGAVSPRQRWSEFRVASITEREDSSVVRVSFPITSHPRDDRTRP